MQVDRIEFTHIDASKIRHTYYRWICSCGASVGDTRERCGGCGCDRFTFIEELAAGKKITPKLMRMKIHETI